MFGKNSFTIIKNGINVERYTFNKQIRKQVRKDFKIDSFIVLGHVGRFSYPKNHEMLIKIFSEICKKRFDIRLMLAGDGELFDDIKELSKKMHVYDRILFLGNRSDIAELLQAVDLFLFPSIYEGLGISLIEAQASGLECMVSDKVPDEVKITDNIMFLPLDYNLWVKKILAFSNEYIRGCYDRQIKNAGYDIKTEVKQLINVYKK